MKFDLVFNHVKKSEKLKQYAGEKLDKLQKFELKPFSIQFIFSEEKKQKYAELVINGKNKRWVAKGYGQNLYQAVDQCIHRMSAQLKKNKDKLQKHKKPQLSGTHALECLNDQLEYDYSKIKGASGQKAA
ncbi:MAG: ribosomal subunit interface protein [Bdellovibrionaceae bacterium]|nr:ribosomal subunit interface protein [Pseudobdellovibrionaceae bacterium]|tara:strand:- start:1258 stop:1647 length:390 start_codon:yes stop_codon:yes gene_type:complete